MREARLGRLFVAQRVSALRGARGVGVGWFGSYVTFARIVDPLALPSCTLEIAIAGVHVNSASFSMHAYPAVRCAPTETGYRR